MCPHTQGYPPRVAVQLKSWVTTKTSSYIRTLLICTYYGVC